MEAPELYRRLRANRIAGELREATSAATFERTSRCWPWKATARWPRSGPADVEAATAAARSAAGAWRRLGRAERVARLIAAHAALERESAGEPLAAGLGLLPGELAERHQEELFRLREALEILREGPEADPEADSDPAPGAFLAHWSDLAAGLGLRLAGRLAAGHTAVLWSDPRLPEGAALLAEACESGGVLPGVVGLLHDDLGASLRWALDEGGLAWARLKGTPEELERLGTGALERSLWPISSSTALVLEGEDPAERAAELALKALGRSATLTGQWPGQVGRIICHQRLFSRFSEELLHGLETAPEPPVPAIDGDLPGYVRRAWALGIDEGATPIFGGGPLVRPAEPPPGAAASPQDAPPAGGGAARGRAPRAVPPVVFTNVEPHQRLAGLSRPAPIVVLMRAPTDEAARELAHALERSSRDPLPGKEPP